ncbi:hypothetical protein V5F59_05745 [Xanthobacter autotrophicus DSM 431]|uniref:hypothetical protein n=1 Tax=Xanthobacter nonsaccharivorans TaxID=3119912 RepID=UPI003728E5E4
MTIRERALASVPTPHAAILEILSEHGPMHLSVLAGVLDMRVGAVRPAIQDLVAEGKVLKLGWMVARASYWQRYDGFVVACIHCNGTPSRRPRQAHQHGPDAA